MTHDKHKLKVFISHSHKDSEYIKLLMESLQELTDIEIIDPKNLLSSGKTTLQNNSRLVKESDLILTLLTTESKDNPNVLFELGMAIALNKKIIPITKQNTDISSIPFDIKSRNIIVSRTPLSTAKRVVKDISKFKAKPVY